MAREDTLSIFEDDGVTAQKLAEAYAELTDMIQASALSMSLKNTNLSGDPLAGSVEVSRLLTAASQAYGTARTASAGDKVEDNKVTINLDQDKEIVEEIENKDLKYYTIGDIIAKRVNNHNLAMVRELDNAFFTEAEAEGTEETITSTTIDDKMEELIQAVETVSNGNVDGVPRDMLAVTVTPSIYGELRTYIDTLANPMGGGVDVNLYHGVRIYSNTRQTEDAICMAIGSVAQPLVVNTYQGERIPLSDAWAIELFYNYGTQAVMPDLIYYASFSEVSA